MKKQLIFCSLLFLQPYFCVLTSTYSPATPFLMRQRQSQETEQLYTALGRSQNNFRTLPKFITIYPDTIFEDKRKVVYGINDLLDATRSLRDHNLAVSARIETDQATQKSLLIARLTHVSSKQYVESEILLPTNFTQQTGQVANKAMVAQTTYAYKYLLVTLLGIPCPLENEANIDSNNPNAEMSSNSTTEPAK